MLNPLKAGFVINIFLITFNVFLPRPPQAHTFALLHARFGAYHSGHREENTHTYSYYVRFDFLTDLHMVCVVMQRCRSHVQF